MHINHIPLFYGNIINIYLYYPILPFILYHRKKQKFILIKKIIINSLATKNNSTDKKGNCWR